MRVGRVYTTAGHMSEPSDAPKVTRPQPARAGTRGPKRIRLGAVVAIVVAGGFIAWAVIGTGGGSSPSPPPPPTPPPTPPFPGRGPVAPSFSGVSSPPRRFPPPVFLARRTTQPRLR